MPTKTKITVIGLGPMGRSMADTFLRHNISVTVYNRTPAKADALVAAGAARAGTASAALNASDLILISLTDYPAMYALLDNAVDQLSGKVLVNLSSGTPDELTAASTWADDHGATLITGGIMVPAELVGESAAYTFYAGDQSVLEQHREVLQLLSRLEFVGSDPALAMYWYQAMLDSFMITLAGVYHAAALIRGAGVPAKEIVPRLSESLAEMPFFLTNLADHLDRRSYDDEGASLAMMAAGIDHITRTSEAVGIDASLPAAVRTLHRRALELGHGAADGSSIYEAIIAPAKLDQQ